MEGRIGPRRHDDVNVLFYLGGPGGGEVAGPGLVFLFEAVDVGGDVFAEVDGSGDGVPAFGEVFDFAFGDAAAFQGVGEFSGVGVGEQLLKSPAVLGGIFQEEHEAPELCVIGVDIFLGHFDDLAG